MPWPFEQCRAIFSNAKRKGKKVSQHVRDECRGVRKPKKKSKR